MAWMFRAMTAEPCSSMPPMLGWWSGPVRGEEIAVGVTGEGPDAVGPGSQDVAVLLAGRIHAEQLSQVAVADAFPGRAVTVAGLAERIVEERTDVGIAGRNAHQIFPEAVRLFQEVRLTRDGVELERSADHDAMVVRERPWCACAVGVEVV